MSNATYIPVYVLTSPKLGDCSNGGVTSDPDITLVVEVEGGFLTDEEVDKRGYVRLLEIPPAFKDCPVRFQPETTEADQCFMSGGNFVHSSDSRFRRAYGWHPISVHDRVES